MNSRVELKREVFLSDFQLIAVLPLDFQELVRAELISILFESAFCRLTLIAIIKLIFAIT